MASDPLCAYEPGSEQVLPITYAQEAS
jgi:hypothetical protein